MRFPQGDAPKRIRFRRIKHLLWLNLILGIAVLTCGSIMDLGAEASTGTWTANQFFYKPLPGARGQVEKGLFDNGLDRVDARLGKVSYITDGQYGAVGDGNHDDTAAIQAAINDLSGKGGGTLIIPKGTYKITGSLTSPAPVALKIDPLGILNLGTGITLAINGGLEAGAYAIFHCAGTGKVVFGSKVTKAYPEWWGAVNNGITDSRAACQSALSSLASGGTVQLQTGTYKFSAPAKDGFCLTWPVVNGLSFVGRGMGATTILLDFGHASDEYHGIKLAPTFTVTGVRLANFSIHGQADQAAVPGEAIELNNHLYDVVIEGVEIYWVRGAGIRSTSSIPGARHTYQNNYLHDICTANMTASVGSAGGIQGAVPQTRIINNRLINIGNNNYWHGIYSIADNLEITSNYLEGTYTHIHVYGDTHYNVSICNNTLKSTKLIAFNVNGLTVSGNSLYNSFMSVGSGCIGYTVSGNTIYNSDVDGMSINFNGSDGSITGNTIYGKGTVGQSSGFVAGSTASDNIVISGNTVRNCSMGLYFYTEAALTNIKVVNNTFKGPGSGGDHYCMRSIPETVPPDNIEFSNNTVIGYRMMIYITRPVNNMIANNNKLKDVIYIFDAYTDNFGPITLDNNMAVDTVLTNPYAYAPTATKSFSLTNTWRLPDGKTKTLTDTASPYVWLGKQFKTGGTTGITHLLGSCQGQIITILAAHSVTIHHNEDTNPGNIQLKGGTDFAMTAGKSLTLQMFDQDVWREIARSE